MENLSNIKFVIRRSSPPFYFAGKMITTEQEEFELPKEELKWCDDVENATKTTDFRSLTRTANYLWSIDIDVEKVVADV